MVRPYLPAPVKEREKDVVALVACDICREIGS
jgi:hypothetical protein